MFIIGNIISCRNFLRIVFNFQYVAYCKVMNKNATQIVKKNLLAGLVLLLGMSMNANAQIGNETVFGFLNIPVSARTAALGGDHVSLDRGGTALLTTNPAYVNETTHKQLSVSYLNHLYDIYLGSAGFSYHFEDIGSVATSLRFVNYGDFTRMDSDGNSQGSFRSYDFSWSTSFSRQLFDDFQAGLGTQLITSRYDTYRSTALALFGGVIYSMNDDYTHFGLSFRNLGYQLTAFDETAEDLPFNITAGVTHRLQHLPLRFNLALHSLNRREMPVFDDEDDTGFTTHLFRHIRFGVEILFTENVNLRLGYDRLKNEELKTDRRIDLAGSGIGLGLTIKDIRFDISRVAYSETGGLVQISLGTRF